MRSILFITLVTNLRLLINKAKNITNLRLLENNLCSPRLLFSGYYQPAKEKAV
ncbi:hypothetical protein NIES2107_33940 [Nostoc carneum NIES-2107]|nr:hypothetical protein NIES2107_33940 [Nostoc carneum NIES-2107]